MTRGALALSVGLLSLGVVACDTPSNLPADAVQQTGPPIAAGSPAKPAEREIRLADTIRRGDQVLFVGDDITQQMYYTRSTASALLALVPDGRLRFFNGGKEGATAASTNEWVDDLIVLVKPTVVVVCLGYNDGKDQDLTDEMQAAYRRDLGEVIGRVKGYEHVRLVVVLSPPPIQGAVANTKDMYGENIRLQALAKVAREVAVDKGALYVGLFDYLLQVYDEANRLGGAPLTFGGGLPGEAAHTMIASALLFGLGVTPKQLEPIGWSPLLPRDMGVVRQALAIRVKPPTLEQAQASRTLYEQLRRADEVFFRYWRLADRPTAVQQRQELKPKLVQTWAQIQAMASRIYSPQTGVQAGGNGG